MVFDLTQPPFILINQQGMIEDIVSSTNTSVNTATNTNSSIRSEVLPKTPVAPYLFDINTDSDLPPEPLQIIFHSTVAKLIHISTRTRQDLLTTISLLSKRVLNPTREDWNKLQRALGYLENTKTQNLKLGMTIPLTIRTYITHHLLYTQITNLTRKCTSAWKLEFSMLNRQHRRLIRLHLARLIWWLLRKVSSSLYSLHIIWLVKATLCLKLSSIRTINLLLNLSPMGNQILNLLGISRSVITGSRI